MCLNFELCISNIDINKKLFLLSKNYITYENNKTTLYDEKVCQDKIKHVAGEKVPFVL